MKRWKAIVAAGLLVPLLASPAAGQLLPPIPRGEIAIGLEPIATGLGAPNWLTTAGDGTNRLFVVEQAGTIRVIENGLLLPQPFLDISSRLMNSGFNPGNPNDERGFLGLAFHPGFANPTSPGFGKFYTYTSESAAGGTPDFPVPFGGGTNHHSVIAEWQVNAGVVDPTSRREILRIGQPQANHNGGALVFGPDGFLYISLGDGGGANDVGAGHNPTIGNGQDITNILGDIVRIDPINPSLTPGSTNPISANEQYRIPADNPFVGPTEGADEIFAFGFRNPFRMSFDSLTGELFVGDVGQGSVEEIDRVVLGGNYGWATKEGSFLFNRANGTISPDLNPDPNLLNPVFEYTNRFQGQIIEGIAVIGGFVYRGSEIPELFGRYVFGDLLRPASGSGRLFYGDLETGEIKEFILLNPLGFRLLGFGEDDNGELYVLASNGAPNGTAGVVLQIVPSPEPASIALLGIGGLGLLGYAWRRRRSRG